MKNKIYTHITFLSLDYIKVKNKIYTPSDRRRRGWARIGREEEGTSSFRAELAALLMLLREAPDEEDVVALLGRSMTTFLEAIRRRNMGAGMAPRRFLAKKWTFVWDRFEGRK